MIIVIFSRLNMRVLFIFVGTSANFMSMEAIERYQKVFAMHAMRDNKRQTLRICS